MKISNFEEVCNLDSANDVIKDATDDGKEEPDFDVEEPSYQEMLHGNLRRMSNTVRQKFIFCNLGPIQ